VRILVTDDPAALGPDFWLLDETVFFMDYDEDGNCHGVDVDDDPAVVASWSETRDALLQEAVPSWQVRDPRQEENRMSEQITAQFPEESFFKSGDSATTGCVEVSLQPGAVGVRDSKNRTGPVLAFTEHEWDVFVAGVKKGEFDRQ
jgi:hypothetical protein